MRDSWIDQDEFDKLVGEFSHPKKRRRQPLPRRSKAQEKKADTMQPSEEEAP